MQVKPNKRLEVTLQFGTSTWFNLFNRTPTGTRAKEASYAYLQREKELLGYRRIRIVFVIVFVK